MGVPPFFDSRFKINNPQNPQLQNFIVIRQCIRKVTVILLNIPIRIYNNKN